MPSPKEEAEELMNSILPLAKEMLARYHEFYPYAGSMSLEGEIIHIGGKIEGTDRPKSQDLIDLFFKDFRENARKREIKAMAIVYDVRIKPPGQSEKSDAIKVSLEHWNGYSADVFFPYSIKNERLLLGEIFAQRRDPKVFVGK